MARTHPYNKVMLGAILTVCLLTVAFLYVYWVYPLPGDWNDTVLNFSFTFAATIAAWIATLISRYFKQGEPPRRVWMNLALGLWGWALAELIWAILALFQEVPNTSWADIPWLGAYYFFATAFIEQFRLIAHPTPAHEHKWLSIALGVVILGAALVTLVVRAMADTGQTWLDTYVSIFYVFADMTLAMAALKIARTFGNGLLGRAWIGLLIFAISDLIYSALLITGLYAQSAKSNSVLSMFADATYFDAYLITALTLLTNYILYRYGPKPIPASAFGDPSLEPLEPGKVSHTDR